MAFDKSISFKTDQFDCTSELPSEYNAGNRFYGRDVAAYFCERLAAGDFSADFLDEDWGWLILVQSDSSTRFEIAIYNINDHGEGGRPGAPEWGLWIRAFERKKVWVLLPRKVEIAVPANLEDAVLEAIRALGSVPSGWVDGPRA